MRCPPAVVVWTFALWLLSWLALVSFHDAAGEICEKGEYTGEKECPKYGFFLFSLIKVVKTLDHHEGTVVGLGTLFVAAFTWALVRSTNRLWEEAKATSKIAVASANAAKESADAAVAASIPVLEPFITQGPLHPLDAGQCQQEFTAIADFVFRNLGKTPAIVQEVRAGLFLCQGEVFPSVDYGNLTLYSNEPWVAGADAGPQVQAIVECRHRFTLTAEQATQLLSEENATSRRFALIGKVIYDDLFGYRHTRHFCLKLRHHTANGLFQTTRGGRKYNNVSREKVG